MMPIDGSDERSIKQAADNPNIACDQITASNSQITVAGNYRLDAVLSAMMDSTDESVSVNSTSSRTTSIDTNNPCNNTYPNRNGWKEDNALFNRNSDLQNGVDLLEDDDDDMNHTHRDGGESNYQNSIKRNSDYATAVFQNDDTHRTRRHRGSPPPSSSDDVSLSSLTKRLNQMSVQEREKALYDLHGIPLDDEYYDNQLGVRGNNIERDPQRLNELLLELEQLVEERIRDSKSSYKGGEDFGEKRAFPVCSRFHKEGKEISNQEGKAKNIESDNLHNVAPPAVIFNDHLEQRIRFLQCDLDDKEFGEGLRLAREQDPGYVHAQRIKFLRADRYDVKLASGRMIRYFDTKRELFCAPGYNEGNKRDISSCLGRDLRLSDFSKEDLELWKNTGFLQLCGMRDRAKRAIIVLFGKVLAQAMIPTPLVLRAYLYVCNLWSRNESLQKGGFVVIGYTAFNDSCLRRSPSAASGRDVAVPKASSDSEDDNEDLVERYLKQTYPLLSQVVKVGMSAQLRGVSRHFCYDHPKLHAQFEQLAGYMSTFSAARFRCHYANANDSASSLFRLGTPIMDNDTSSNITRSAHADRTHTREKRKNEDAALTFHFNPHKELLYTLMTFGIPRDTIPIDDLTGEVDLEFHQAILEAIEEREEQDRVLEAATSVVTSGEPDARGTVTSVRAAIEHGCAEHQNGDKLWLSLTASTSSVVSFSVFPNLVDEEESVLDCNHATSSLFGSTTMSTMASITPQNTQPPSIDSPSKIHPSSSAPMVTSSDGYFTRFPPPVEIPRPTEVSSSNLTVRILSPSTNDIMMGRGPWNRHHPGNLRLKAMLERERDRYESVNRFQRMRIVDSMLNELYHDHSVRFLYKIKPKKEKKERAQPGNRQEDSAKRPHQISSGENANATYATEDAWLVAKREKAHDKITHDFRNLRRQKLNIPPNVSKK